MKISKITGAAWAILLGAALPARADLVSVPGLGLWAERGFRVTLFADNDLAPDTWCMTLDALGRVVVANGQSIRTLIDDDDDGFADRAVEFAQVKRGVMGMCFEGTSLYVVADGWFERFDDEDGDGIADGPPEQLVPIGFGEHGGHAIRKGPDGWWYVIGGNDSGFLAEKHATLGSSPVRRPEAGALLRITPDGHESEIIAHGFRNPYDFDFNADGDIFTFDSDVERDAFLPWYQPTRIYHVGYGQHHGWRLTGYQRSWPRPDYYADTVPILARVGRGSPTGLTVYRHFQFPDSYRDGLFFADWTFGRVYFLPLKVYGASYAIADPQVFIEPAGTQGFAPTDLAVGTDGAMFISIGGRKTRGAVYRVEHAGASESPGLPLLPNADLNNVLAAPQPLDAWSRAIWMPAASQLGPLPFAAIVSDVSMSMPFRVRAIEVMTEMFGGVPAGRARVAAQSNSSEVRARIAWSLGRWPGENASALLLELAQDNDATVRRCALDAIADQLQFFRGADLIRIVQAGMTHEDKYVRLAAASVGSLMDNDSWQELTTLMPRNSPAVNTAAIAQSWRTPDLSLHPEMVPALTNLLAQSRDPLVQSDAVRLLILALGDWHLEKPSAEAFTGYELSVPPGEQFDLTALRRVIRELIPSKNPQLNTEVTRLLAMLEDDDKRTTIALANFITDATTATSDFHYLTCLARIRGNVPELSGRIASAILDLDRKLAGQGMRVKQNWNTRLVEVAQQLIRREPSIGDALLRHPQLAASNNVFLTQAFEGDRKIDAAHRFLAVVKANPSFPWTSELVTLLALLPPDEVVPLFRRQWPNVALRDQLLPVIAENPAAGDRPKFLAGLGSTQPASVRLSLAALLQLPPDPTGTNLVAPLRLLSRSLADPAAQSLRGQLISLLATNLKQNFKIQEPPGGDTLALRKAYQPIFDYLGGLYPGLLRAMSAEDNDDPLKWNGIWRTAPWTRGNMARGAEIYAQRGCVGCHGVPGAIGPDLAGAAQRFSREDLLNAVVFPSRDVAPPYRTTTFRLRNGETYTGIVAFESADGWIVQTGAGLTVRVNSADVVAHEPSSLSVMPSGLLQGLSGQQVADLYAFLSSLSGAQ